MTFSASHGQVYDNGRWLSEQEVEARLALYERQADIAAAEAKSCRERFNRLWEARCAAFDERNMRLRALNHTWAATPAMEDTLADERMKEHFA